MNLLEKYKNRATEMLLHHPSSKISITESIAHEMARVHDETLDKVRKEIKDILQKLSHCKGDTSDVERKLKSLIEKISPENKIS